MVLALSQRVARPAAVLGLWLALALCPRPVRAEVIYRYRDTDGVVHLSNRRVSEAAVPCDMGPPRGAMRLPCGARRTRVLPFIRYYCRRYGVDPELVGAMVAVESDFAADAVSPSGACGLMQIMPATGQSLGLDDAFDGARNLEAGIRYLRGLLDAYGDTRLAVAAYNAGPGRVRKGEGLPDIPETRGYVDKVMALYGH